MLINNNHIFIKKGLNEKRLILFFVKLNFVKNQYTLSDFLNSDGVIPQNFLNTLQK